jgi:hypothetical protein
MLKGKIKNKIKVQKIKIAFTEVKTGPQKRTEAEGRSPR